MTCWSGCILFCHLFLFITSNPTHKINVFLRRLVHFEWTIAPTMPWSDYMTFKVIRLLLCSHYITLPCTTVIVVCTLNQQHRVTHSKITYVRRNRNYTVQTVQVVCVLICSEKKQGREKIKRETMDYNHFCTKNVYLPTCIVFEQEGHCYK